MADRDIIVEEYKIALEELLSNRKPLITMLTMLADEGKVYALAITQVVNVHIKIVPISSKLPAIYLLDSIVKNVGGEYIRHFGASIAQVFPSVFKEVDEKSRKKLYELRQTWNDIFAKSRLYLLDCNVREIDPAWPITSQSNICQTPNIHVNPKFRPSTMGYPPTSKTPPSSSFIPAATSSSTSSSTHDMEELRNVQNEKKVLAEQRKKVELQLLKDSKALPSDSKAYDPDIKDLTPTSRPTNFMSKYKIKKKSPPEKLTGGSNDKVLSNIHVAPWAAKAILPSMKDISRGSKDSAGSYRVGIGAQQEGSHKSRDPRLNKKETSSKDAKFNSKFPPPVKVQRNTSAVTTVQESQGEKLLKAPHSASSSINQEYKTERLKDPRSTIVSNESSRDKSRFTKKIYTPTSSPQKERKEDKSKTRKLKKDKDDKEKGELDEKQEREERERKIKEEKLKMEKELIERLEKERIEAEKLEKDTMIKKDAELKANQDAKTKKEIEIKMRESEAKLKKDIEIRIKKEAEAKLKKEIEERTKKEGESRMRRETEEKIKKEAEAKIKKDAEAKSKKEIEFKNRKEMEAKAKRDHDTMRIKKTTESIKIKKDIDERVNKETKMKIKEDKLKNDEKLKKKKIKLEKERHKINEDQKYNNKKNIDLEDYDKTCDKTNKSLKRRREHIRPRDHSSEEEVKTVKPDPDSEDSDHYDANKPPPTAYTIKKELKTGINQDTDTDLRLLSGNIKDQVANIALTPQKSPMTNLFGSSDTDLRQIPPATVPFSTSRIATSDVPLGVVPLVFETHSDEDMRVPPVSKDPHLTIADAESMKKSVLNNPQAENWEKFRDLNPEFKEYQRHSSLTDSLENEFPDQRGPEGGDEKSVKDIDNRRDMIEDQRIDNFKIEGTLSKENFQHSAEQVMDKMKRGQISDGEYRRRMEKLRVRVEQDKIREVCERDRPFSPLAQRSQFPNHRFQEQTQEQFMTRNDSYGSFHRGRDQGLPHRVGPFVPKLEAEFTDEPDLPTITEDVLRNVTKANETRTIEIDSRPKEIRTYGEKAIILLNWNEPRTLSFEDNSPCNVKFDDDYTLPMSTGENYRMLKIDNVTHRIKLGVPTQELFIDGKGYQCFFGGKATAIHLVQKVRCIKLEGRPPKVDIGRTRNLEFLAGRIELTINAGKIIPLFLDAKPQQFFIDGMPFVIKFIDSFRSVAINGRQFAVKFGGLPIDFSVRGYRQFLSFSELPSGVVPGEMHIRGMDMDGNVLMPSYPITTETSTTTYNKDNSLPQSSEFSRHASHQSRLPRPNLQHPRPMGPPLQQPIAMSGYPHTTSFNMEAFAKPPPPLNMATFVSPAANVVPGSYLTSASDLNAPAVAAESSSITSFKSVLQTPEIDVHHLLNTLVKSGVIGGPKHGKSGGGGATSGVKPEKSDAVTVVKSNPTSEDKTEKKKKTIGEPSEFNSKKQKITSDNSSSTKKESEEEEVDDIDDLKDIASIEYMFSRINLRKMNYKLIKKMHGGTQCSSCGLRYPSKHSVQYSRHLDWHFRMNKKQQDSTKKVSTRKYYLYLDEWLQYEEIEDATERVSSMFETDGDKEGASDKDSSDNEDEIPSVAAISNDPSSGVCPICHETFDQFYNQNTEEWHYKYAIDVEGLNYHPTCHSDFIKSQKQEEERVKKEREEAEDKIKKDEEERLKKEEEDKLRKEEEDILRKEEEEKRMKEEEEERLKREEEDARLKKENEEEKLKQREIETSELKYDETVDKRTENDAMSEIEVLPSIENIEAERVPSKDELEVIKQERPLIPSVTILDSDEEDKENVSPPKRMRLQSRENESMVIDSEEYRKIKRRTRSRKCYSQTNTTEGEQYGISEIRIKEEPQEKGEEGFSVFVPLFETEYPLFNVPFALDFPIKIEISDKPYSIYEVNDDEEDNPSDSMIEEPVRVQTNNLAMTDVATTIDGNTEHTEANQNPTNVPKIKFSVSIPLTNSNHVEESTKEDDRSDEDLSFLEEFTTDYTAPPFVVNYAKKPGFRGVHLASQPIRRRPDPEEMSSLCSIM